MRRFTVAVLLPFAAAMAQRGGSDWMNAGNDPQRSHWVRSDEKINPANIQKPDFKFLWKVKTANQSSAALTLNRYIGYRGFRSLAFVLGTSGNITAIDTDLGRIEWQKSVSAPGGVSGCGTLAGLARPTSAAFPGAVAGRGFGGGRGAAAKSAVGEPGEGAVIIQEVAARAAAAPPPNMAGRAGRGGRAGAPGAPGGYNPFQRGPAYLYMLSPDGMLHALYISNGEEPNPPMPFLPANSNAQGLIVVSNVAYATTVHGCGSASDQVFALDLGDKQLSKWDAASAGGLAGSGIAAFGPDDTVYVTTGNGGLVALEGKTLKMKDAYKAGSPFVTSPVVFEHKDKTLIAAATKDGTIHVLDAASPTSAIAKVNAGQVEGPLASWQDSSGTRWLLAPTGKTITAWKLADQNGTLSLQPGWTSRDMVSPQTPTIVDGVVFAVSAGSRNTPAVLYGLDGETGKELWSSGKTMTSYVSNPEALSAGNTELYLGTNDGTVYVFGFWIEH